jgi:hypothetical protein
VSAPCSDWPSTPDFHPEFGLLCPSPRRRRSMRLAMACVIAGVAIGATMELAIAHWRDSDAASPVVSSIDREPPVEDAAVPTISDVPVISVPHAASTNDAGAATATRTQGVCKEVGVKDLAAEFLNPTCGSGKPRARHATRTTNRVATMIVSRIEPVPAAAEPAPVTQATVETAPCGRQRRSQGGGFDDAAGRASYAVAQKAQNRTKRSDCAGPANPRANSTRGGFQRLCSRTSAWARL